MIKGSVSWKYPSLVFYYTTSPGRNVDTKGFQIFWIFVKLHPFLIDLPLYSLLGRQRIQLDYALFPNVNFKEYSKKTISSMSI